MQMRFHCRGTSQLPLRMRLLQSLSALHLRFLWLLQSNYRKNLGLLWMLQRQHRTLPRKACHSPEPRARGTALPIQGYLTLETPPPGDHHRALGIGLMQGPRVGRFLVRKARWSSGGGGQFLVIEVPL